MYKILIVDDEPLERKALRSILKEGIPLITQFEEASDGQGAIDAAKEIAPHIVLMDIQMPRINGVEASREIKKSLPDCRIILMSGYTYFSYAREAVSIGLQDFLVKPLDDDELIASVQTLIDGLEFERNHKNQIYNDKDEKMDHLFNYYEREFINSQVFRKASTEELSHFIDLLDINDGFFLGIILSHDENDIALTEKDHHVIREIANLSFERDRVITSIIDRRVYILFLLTDFRANLILQTQLETFLSYLDESIQAVFRISSGSMKNNYQDIFESFNEARIAINQEERISFFQFPLSSKETIFPINDEEKLCEYLMKRDRQKALEYAGSIYYWIDQNTSDFSQFKIRIYDLMVVLNRRVRREMDPGDSLLYFSQIDSIDNRNGIKTYLTNEVQSLIDKLNFHFSTYNKAWKKQITHYMENNYKKSISLEALADLAGFSAPYLSRIFSNEFGMNFSSYVNSLRIREAMKLLSQGDLSIKEISYELGFSDSNYFARVFKKMTGVNASQYQKNPDSEV